MRRVRGRIEVHVTEPGCPLKGVRLMNEVEPTNENFPASKGTFVHSVMDEMVSQIMGGIDPNMMRAIQVIVDKSDHNEMVYAEDQQGINEVCENGYNWLKQEGFDEIREKYVAKEVPIRTPLEFDTEPFLIKDTPVWVSGTPDLILTDSIIDWKSGKSRSKGHALQISVYSILNTIERKADMLPGRIFYMGIPMREKVYKNGKVHKYHERYIDPIEQLDFVQEWELKMRTYLNAVRDGLEEEPEPVECGDCFFCPFRSMCYGEEELE